MHNHYIINNIIEFHPATSTLRELDDPNNIAVLNSPAGRCLLLLINRRGNIVAQQEMMDVVWEQSGMQVSHNTLYQNISILRKGLKKIGLGEDIIVTIPRIGLTLASDTHIKKISTEKLVEIDHDNVHFMSKDDEEIASDAAMNEPVVAHSEVPSEFTRPNKPFSIAFIRERLSPKCIFFAGICTFIVLSFFIVFTVISNDANHHHFFDKYNEISTHTGCKLYLSNGMSHDDREKALSYMQRIEAACTSYPWVYITRLPMLPRTSIIRCDAPMSKLNTCISDYFFETNK